MIALLQISLKNLQRSTSWIMGILKQKIGNGVGGRKKKNKNA